MVRTTQALVPAEVCPKPATVSIRADASCRAWPASSCTGVAGSKVVPRSSSGFAVGLFHGPAYRSFVRTGQLAQASSSKPMKRQNDPTRQLRQPDNLFVTEVIRGERFAGSGSVALGPVSGAAGFSNEGGLLVLRRNSGGGPILNNCTIEVERRSAQAGRQQRTGHHDLQHVGDELHRHLDHRHRRQLTRDPAIVRPA